MAETALYDAFTTIAQVAVSPTTLVGFLGLCTRVGRQREHEVVETNLLHAVVWRAARLPGVLFALALPLVAWLVCGVGNSHAASPSRSAEAWAVETAFREAFQLWAHERFEALWERGTLTSRYRVSRETFVHGMGHRMVKPTCCWGQLHSVQVHFQTAEEALVEAQVGVDVKTLGTTVMRSMFVYLRREERVWRVALEDFLTRPEGGPPGLGWLW
jgi:hypothetical protein